MSGAEITMKMPDLSTASDEVTVVSWNVKVGEEVKRGQLLLEVETDKSAMDVECIADGVLKEILAEEGTAVGAGQPIAIITKRGAAAAGEVSKPSESETAATATASTSASKEAVAPATGAAAPKRAGGMFGRNRAKASEEDSSTPGEALSQAQQVVGRRMTESKQTVPHFYLQRSINAESLLARRAAAGDEKPVWDAFFVQACARALQKHPLLSKRIEGNQLVSAASDAIGVAVDIDGALYVVTVEDGAEKSIAQISDEIRSNVSAITSGDSAAKKLKPACMSITNLGGSGIDSFIPIINPPEASILGIGRITSQAVVVDEQITSQPRCSLTLCVDHRVANGKAAAAFLAEIVYALESKGAE